MGYKDLTVAVPSAMPTFARCAFLCHVHYYRATHHVRTVQFVDGTLRRLIIGHLYETVTLATTREAILDDTGILHFAIVREQSAQFVFLVTIRKTSNKNVHFSNRTVNHTTSQMYDGILKQTTKQNTFLFRKYKGYYLNS